ncbi:hypothetical protein BpHYR1_019756 [Brachionus plicatilis]|uniref:Uncharacterized protein n=1 Tax=Brachionus plicatilis TaxID=10195 RepID=A0A3M7PQL0_BRAPC|nr:hypothetical protein BpHYR1_019756 [Brachionus plicatilis]
MVAKLRAYFNHKSGQRVDLGECIKKRLEPMIKEYYQDGNYIFCPKGCTRSCQDCSFYARYHRKKGHKRTLLMILKITAIKVSHYPNIFRTITRDKNIHKKKKFDKKSAWIEGDIRWKLLIKIHGMTKLLSLRRSKISTKRRISVHGLVLLQPLHQSSHMLKNNTGVRRLTELIAKVGLHKLLQAGLRLDDHSALTIGAQLGQQTGRRLLNLTQRRKKHLNKKSNTVQILHYYLISVLFGQHEQTGRAQLDYVHQINIVHLDHTDHLCAIICLHIYLRVRILFDDTVLLQLGAIQRIVAQIAHNAQQGLDTSPGPWLNAGQLSEQRNALQRPDLFLGEQVVRVSVSDVSDGAQARLDQSRLAGRHILLHYFEQHLDPVGPQRRLLVILVVAGQVGQDARGQRHQSDTVLLILAGDLGQQVEQILNKLLEAVYPSGRIGQISEYYQTILEYVGTFLRVDHQAERLHGVQVDQCLFVVGAHRQHFEQSGQIEQQFVILVGLIHEQSDNELSAAQLQNDLFGLGVAERQQLKTVDHDGQKFDVLSVIEKRNHLMDHAHFSQKHFDLVATVEQHVVQSGDGVGDNEGADKAARGLQIGSGVQTIDQTLDRIAGLDQRLSGSLHSGHLVEQNGGLLHHDQVFVDEQLEQVGNGLERHFRVVLLATALSSSCSGGGWTDSAAATCCCWTGCGAVASVFWLSVFMYESMLLMEGAWVE